MPWRENPISIRHWPQDITHTVFIDESGSADMKGIQKHILSGTEIPRDQKVFTTTACLINLKDFGNIRDRFVAIKEAHWQKGRFNYPNGRKRVCFHSSEIRGAKGPFSNTVINRSDFLTDLNQLLTDAQYEILSTSILKEEHYRRYAQPYYPYKVCLEFIFERIVKYRLADNESCVVMLESRGVKENKFLLNEINGILNNGTKYTSSKCFEKIRGVYFNPKWCSYSKNQKTHFGLEIADLSCYPIWRHILDNSVHSDANRAYSVVQSKMYNFPFEKGYGLKVFPKK